MRSNKILNRLFTLTNMQKIGFLFLGITFVIISYKPLKYTYTEIVGEKDIEKKALSLIERYHQTKINGEWINNGSYTSFYRMGVKKEEGLYVNGKKDKMWLSFYENGKLNTKIEYNSGLKNGICEEFFENGNLSITGYYHDDKRAREWKQFFPNQNVQAIKKYSNDMGNGKYLSFFPNKANETEGYFRNDTLVGEWVFWNDQGTVIQKLTYFNGIILYKVKFWQNGLMSCNARYDSTGQLLEEDYFDEAGKTMILKFVGAWKDEGEDFYYIGIGRSKSYSRIRIDPNRKYEKTAYSYTSMIETQYEWAEEATTTTRGIAHVTNDSIIFNPQRIRRYPSRHFYPQYGDRWWIDNGSKEWNTVPDSDNARAVYSLQDFQDVYKRR